METAMNEILNKYTREELEKMILHMTAFAAYQLATEYIELTEPLAKQIRTPEAELENTKRILEFIVLAYPAWDVIELTHPAYDVMRKWVEENHKIALLKPCICDGCKDDARIQ